MAEPVDLQQCGYCAGWTRDQLWCRIQFIGDEDGGVIALCKECGYTPTVLAYKGYNPPEGALRVYSEADLIEVAERHVVQVHG